MKPRIRMKIFPQGGVVRFYGLYDDQATRDVLKALCKDNPFCFPPEKPYYQPVILDLQILHK